MKHRFLIIDNKTEDANLSIRCLNDAGLAAGQSVSDIETIPVIKPNSTDMLLIVKKILKDQWFVGTILDLLYNNNETDGGIRLWNGLTVQEKANAGKLVVVTKGDAEAIPGFNTFVKDHATGLCQSSKRADRIAIFKEIFFT